MHSFPNLIRLMPVVTATLALMHAAPPTESARHPLAGTWELVRADIAQADGVVTTDPNYGPHATGLLLVDPAGRYSLQVFRPDRPKFASGDKAKGTPEEYKAALLGLSTHTGRISADTQNRRLVFHIEWAAFPNWAQTEQIRAYELKDGELSYRIPPRPGGSSAISVWRRID